jgi:hypothetical protein
LYSWLKCDDRAIEYYRFALEASQDNFLAADQMFRLGLSLSKVGLVDEGVDLQQRAVAIAQTAGLDIFLVMGRLAGVLILIIQGKLDQAKTEGLLLQEETQKRSIRPVYLLVTNALGMIALEMNLPAAIEGSSTQPRRPRMSQRWINQSRCCSIRRCGRQASLTRHCARVGLILMIGTTATKNQSGRIPG